MCLLYLSVPEKKNQWFTPLCSILRVFVRFYSVLINAMTNYENIFFQITIVANGVNVF